MECIYKVYFLDQIFLEEIRSDLISSRKISEQLIPPKLQIHLCKFALPRASVGPTSFCPYDGMIAMIMNNFKFLT